MDFLQLFNTIIAFLSDVDQVAIGNGLKCIGAGIAVFTGLGPALGEGNVAAHAMDAMARQPEIAGTIRTSMLIGQAVAETTGLYGLIIAFLILFI